MRHHVLNLAMRPPVVIYNTAAQSCVLSLQRWSIVTITMLFYHNAIHHD
jgi:hypothetical protein